MSSSFRCYKHIPHEARNTIKMKIYHGCASMNWKDIHHQFGVLLYIDFTEKYNCVSMNWNNHAARANQGWRPICNAGNKTNMWKIANLVQWGKRRKAATTQSSPFLPPVNYLFEHLWLRNLYKCQKGEQLDNILCEQIKLFANNINMKLTRKYSKCEVSNQKIMVLSSSNANMPSLNDLH